MKHDEPDEKELERLESRLRKAVPGQKPETPASLLDFIGSVPARGTTRRMGISFGGLGLWHGLAVAGVSAAVLVAVAGTAVLMSNGPDRGTAVASGTMGAPSAELGTPTDSGTPTDYTPASEWPSTSASLEASLTSSASAPQRSTPTLDWGASPSEPTLPPASRTIAGTVTNKAGQPVVGMAVFANAKLLRAHYTVKTDGNGRYSMWVVADSYYVGDMDSSGTYWHVSHEVDVTAGDALAVDIVLPPAVHVTVKVVDEAGNPLAGIDCRLVENIPEYPATTNAAGLATWAVQNEGYFFVYIPGVYRNYATPDFTVTEGSADLYFVLVRGPDGPPTASPSGPPPPSPSAT